MSVQWDWDAMDKSRVTRKRWRHRLHHTDCGRRRWRHGARLHCDDGTALLAPLVGTWEQVSAPRCQLPTCGLMQCGTALPHDQSSMCSHWCSAVACYAAPNKLWEDTALGRFDFRSRNGITNWRTDIILAVFSCTSWGERKDFNSNIV